MSLVLASTALAAGQPAYHSVRDFGADGSGRHDDTSAIQSAIDAAGQAGAANGGVVFFPAGRYRITATLVVSGSGITLMGEGCGSPSPAHPSGTVLSLHSSTNSTALSIRNGSFSGLRSMCVSVSAETSAPSRPNQAAIEFIGTYHAFAKELLVVGDSSGIEITDGINPVLEDVSFKDVAGSYGIWIHGSGGLAGNHRKVDAAAFTRLSGGAERNLGIEWLVVGPNIDGLAVMYARFVGGSRGLVLRGGNAARGDVRPKYVHTYAFGSDHALNEAVLVEAGSELFMTDTWIGQNRNGAGLVLGPGFAGGAELVNPRIRGSGGNGLEILGGQNIYVMNALIGACATNRTLVPLGAHTGCGILIAAGVKHVRVSGGGVGPLPEMGLKSKQYFGVRYLGTAPQAVADSVRLSGVDTAGNPVEYAPASLSLDRSP